MYELTIKPSADRIFKTLAKKNPKQLQIIQRKLKKMQENPHHSYKFLISPLHRFNRVHIDRHFVLIFQIHHMLEVVEVWYYGHNDEVYKGRFILQE